jgi:hypothetical protein
MIAPSHVFVLQGVFVIPLGLASVRKISALVKFWQLYFIYYGGNFFDCDFY